MDNLRMFDLFIALNASLFNVNRWFLNINMVENSSISEIGSFDMETKLRDDVGKLLEPTFRRSSENKQQIKEIKSVNE